MSGTLLFQDMEAHSGKVLWARSLWAAFSSICSFNTRSGEVPRDGREMLAEWQPECVCEGGWGRVEWANLFSKEIKYVCLRVVS